VASAAASGNSARSSAAGPPTEEISAEHQAYVKAALTHMDAKAAEVAAKVWTEKKAAVNVREDQLWRVNCGRAFHRALT
jgi:hypothetical protein